eukprot:Rhum_TRINITY_DN11438_c0_g1::Rhum_TRINITY_DN11438_c0_g1_i1::g.44717::m.44717
MGACTSSNVRRDNEELTYGDSTPEQRAARRRRIQTHRREVLAMAVDGDLLREGSGTLNPASSIGSRVGSLGSPSADLVQRFDDGRPPPLIGTDCFAPRGNATRDVVTDAHFDSLIDVIDNNPHPMLLIQSDGGLIRVNAPAHALIAPDGAVLNSGVLLEKYLKFPVARVGNPADYSRLTVPVVPQTMPDPESLVLYRRHISEEIPSAHSDTCSSESEEGKVADKPASVSGSAGRYTPRVHSAGDAAARDAAIEADLLNLQKALARGGAAASASLLVPTPSLPPASDAPLVHSETLPAVPPPPPPPLAHGGLGSGGKIDKAEEYFFDANDGSPRFSPARAASPTNLRRRRMQFKGALMVGSTDDLADSMLAEHLPGAVDTPCMSGKNTQHHRCQATVFAADGGVTAVVATTTCVAIGTKKGYVMVLEPLDGPAPESSLFTAHSTVTPMSPDGPVARSPRNRQQTPRAGAAVPPRNPPPLNGLGDASPRGPEPASMECEIASAGDTVTVCTDRGSSSSAMYTPRGNLGVGSPLAGPRSVHSSSTTPLFDDIVIIVASNGTIVDMSRTAQLLTGVDLSTEENPLLDSLLPSGFLCSRGSGEGFGSMSSLSSPTHGVAPSASIFQAIKTEYSGESNESRLSGAVPSFDAAARPSPRGGAGGTSPKVLRMKTREKSVLGQDKTVQLELTNVMSLSGHYIARFKPTSLGGGALKGSSRGFAGGVFGKRIAFSFKGGLSEDMACILESGTASVVACSAQGEILYCNEAALSSLMYKEEDMLKEDVSLLVPEPHRSAHHGYMKRFSKRVQFSIVNQTRYTVAITKQGTILPISLEIRVVQTPQQREIYLCIFNRASVKNGEGGAKLAKMVDECKRHEANTPEAINAYFRSLKGYKERDRSHSGKKVLCGGRQLGKVHSSAHILDPSD